jgi:membrane-bound ClpP family serine protease
MTALGIALLTIGAILVLVEAHVPTLGALGAPGVAALAVGSVLAVSGLGGGILLAVLAAVVLAGSALGVLTISVRKGADVNRRRIRESLIGHIGVVREWHQSSGSVAVDGALWKARRSLAADPDDDSEQIHTGDHVVVERRSGLTLAVRRAEDWELEP